jgi:hypothetical protein
MAETSTVGRYTKRPVTIRAAQWDGTKEGAEALIEALDPDGARGLTYIEQRAGQWEFTVYTLEGLLYISPGDWIIEGVKGELYPCKPDIFDSTYIEVSP